MEKRKERRIKVHIPVKIVYKNNPQILGKTENLSRLGTYVETDRQIPAGSDIDITLEIPVYKKDLSLSGKVKCKGSIFRCNLIREVGPKKRYGLGIFFTDLLKNIDRNKLSEYIDFLILNEERGIKEGVKKWRKKRSATKMSKQPQQLEARQEKFQRETLNLLNQILNRLEEIHHLIIKKLFPS